MKLGRKYVKDVIGMDPYNEIHGYSGKVMLLQGTADRIVHADYARKAAKEYPYCEYHEIEGAGHMFRGKYDRTARAYIRDFYIRELIGGMNDERQ